MPKLEFNLSDAESEAASVFMAVHHVRHGKDKTASGGRFTWQFTNDSLGCHMVILCACGEKENFTDYESW
jgi:hypothetical protein